jgi:alpha-glucosidase
MRMVIVALGLAVLNCAHGNTITSPDGNAVATVSADSGNLSYSISYRGVTVIESSPLGFTINNTNLGEGVVLGGFTSEDRSISFASRQGIHASVAKELSGQIIPVTHVATGIRYALHVAVFNDGIGLRYEFQDGVTRNITAETTGFVLPASSTVWFQTNISDYQGVYSSADIAAITAGTPLGPPATIQLSGTNGFLGLTEASLGAFPNPYLVKSSSASGRQFDVAYPKNVDGTTGSTVSSTVTNTPWNVIMVGADLDGLINNDIVEALSAAPDPVLFPQGAGTSWATTGLSVWDYLNPFPGGITYTNAMTNSYWAARLGWPYNTIDAGWANWNSGNPWLLVKVVTSYSHALGVKVILWKTGSELATQSARASFFQLLTNNGADGLKADFFDFGSGSPSAKERVQLQESILREAAGYHLMVSFHGTSKPTGQFRTYPNLLQFEAVCGKELYPGAFSESIPPFGRLLAGPADFTPLALQGGLLSGKTKAFEIATVVSMPGPLITIAERSDNVAGSPFAALIKTIPSTWDATVVLSQSQIGQTSALARRKGQDWYLAVMNVNARSFGVRLSFLASNVTYQVWYVRDTSTALETTTQTQTNIFPVFSNAGGGEVAWFSPIATNYLPVTLQAGYANSSLQLSWSQGILLEATNVAGPWTTNSGASPLIVSPTEPKRFYRVRVQ